MLRIKPFKALRPTPDFARKTYIFHGNAGDPKKYRSIVESNPYSMLNVSHAELFFSEDEPLESPKVKEKAKQNLDEMLDKGVLIKEDAPSFYVYRMSMANHSQTGLIACVDIQGYIDGAIRRHELTRTDKTLTQAATIGRMGGNMEPILLTYDSSNYDGKLIEEWAYSHPSTYDILDEGGIRHEIWIISDTDYMDKITKACENFDAFYICDGHHRIEASKEYFLKNGDTDPACRYFMGVIFPTEEMLILDYNRAANDQGGESKEEFFKKLDEAGFKAKEIGPSPAYPGDKGRFSMVIDDVWYLLEYVGERNVDNPVEELDVSILQNKVFHGILGIEDPQNDPRIGFISGTKGLEALQDATHDGMTVAFALDPPDMEEIMAVADAGLTMPPKSTCFEPKPLAGLILYNFSRSV